MSYRLQKKRQDVVHQSVKSHIAVNFCANSLCAHICYVTTLYILMLQLFISQCTVCVSGWRCLFFFCLSITNSFYLIEQTAGACLKPICAIYVVINYG